MAELLRFFEVTDEDGRVVPRWWTQSINDNDRKGGGVGSPWRQGRWIVRSHVSHREVLAVEWCHGRRVRPELDVTVSVKPHRVKFHVSVMGVGSWWVALGHKQQEWLSRAMIEERLFGVRVGYIGHVAWLYVAFDDGADDMMSYYREKVARGEQVYFGGNRVQLTQGLLVKVNPRLRDRLLGKVAYSEEVLREEPVVIPFEGREYEAAWKLTRQTWKRPRSLRSKESVASWLDVPHPPAFAGKGENSWDCGDDGIFGCGSTELTRAGAVGDYIKRVLKARERYGPASDPDVFLAKADA